MSLVYAIAAGIICLAGGFFYGLLPLKEENLTAKQKTGARTSSIVVFGVFILLILMKEDMASWVALAGAIVGFGIGKIPPITHFMQTHWSLVAPRRKTKKRSPKK